MLPVHSRLELRQLGKGLVARSPSQQLATRRKSHVDAGEGLHVLVVQRSRDALPLGRRLELAQPRFDDQPLLAEISDQVPGDREVRRAHDVEGHSLGVRDEDQAQIQRHAHARHPHREPQAGSKPGGQHREREEHVEGAVRAFGHQGDRSTEEHVDPRRHGGDSRRAHEPAAEHQAGSDAVDEVRDHDGERPRVQREGSTRERHPARQRRTRRVDVHRHERRHRQDHPTMSNDPLDVCRSISFH